MLDIRDPVSRVSLDTFYQVSFSFGNEDKWFKQSVNSGSKRAAGTTFKKKMTYYVLKLKFQALHI